jgi:putative tricarboxylic transport membrane protein
MPSIPRWLREIFALIFLLPIGAIAQPLLPALRIVAPGSPGGGWDQTARAMADVLRQSGLVEKVEVINSPGAGGAIGLAQFLDQRGKADTLLVGGLVMITAIRAQHATISPDQTTPIARLTGDYEVIAVPSASDLLDTEDLVRALQINPGSVTWGGGSSGGADEQFLAQLAQAIGVEPARMDYIAFSGGGEVREALLAKRLTVGISGYSEFAPAIEAGHLRALAISAPQRTAGVLIPTLREQGVPVTFVNWRGVFAPPGLTEDARRTLTTVVERMVHTPAWRQLLRRNRWTDLYLPAEPFTHFVTDEQARTARTRDPRTSARPRAVWTGEMWLLRHRVLLAIAAFFLAAVAAILILWQRRSGRRRENDLTVRLHKTEARLSGFSNQIEQQFTAWRLTAAEREVAMLMLKGLRHKEIASIRKTSERTVRQQALTIYRKAGLDGRTDLVAFFLQTRTSSPSS